MPAKEHVGAGAEATTELEELVQIQRELNEQLVLSSLRAQQEAEAAESEASDLRSREQALMTLTELFRATFDAHPVVSFVTDEKAVILEANERAATFLRLPREALRRKPLIGFVARGDTRTFRAEVQALKGHMAVVLRFRPRNSSPCPMRLDVVKLPRGRRYLWTMQPASVAAT